MFKENPTAESCAKLPKSMYYQECVHIYDIKNFVKNGNLVEKIKKLKQDGALNSREVNMLVAGSAVSNNVIHVANLLKDAGVDNKENRIFVADYNDIPLKNAQKVIDNFNNFEKTYQSKFLMLSTDLQQASLSKNSMDLILSDFTLNFCEDLACIDKSLQEFKRILKPKGRVFMDIAFYNKTGNKIKKSKNKYGIQLSQELFLKQVQKVGLEAVINKSKIQGDEIIDIITLNKPLLKNNN